MEQTAEELIDQVWHLLNKAYEEMGETGYRKPRFRIVLTHEQIYLLRSHVAKLPFGEQVFIGTDMNTMFGHELQEQRRTPYVEAIIN